MNERAKEDQRISDERRGLCLNIGHVQLCTLERFHRQADVIGTYDCADMRAGLRAMTLGKPGGSKRAAAQAQSTEHTACKCEKGNTHAHSMQASQ